jgi:hypothetical protein
VTVRTHHQRVSAKVANKKAKVAAVKSQAVEKHTAVAAVLVAATAKPAAKKAAAPAKKTAAKPAKSKGK